MVDISMIKEGLLMYADRHMMPILDSKGQFILGVGLGMFARRAEAMMATLAQNELIKTMGIIDGNRVDWESMYVAAIEQIKRQGKLTMDFPLVGRLTFGEGDLRDLNQCIMGG